MTSIRANPTPPRSARPQGPSSAELIDPRALVPESVMPPYAFIAKKPLVTRDASQKYAR